MSKPTELTYLCGKTIDKALVFVDSEDKEVTLELHCGDDTFSISTAGEIRANVVWLKGDDLERTHEKTFRLKV